MLEAIRKRDHFNLLDAQGGDKVDFWVLKDEPYAARVLPDVAPQPISESAST